jgi:hypothetical protein
MVAGGIAGRHQRKGPGDKTAYEQLEFTMKTQIDTTSQGSRLNPGPEKVLQKVEVGITPYLEIVSLRNAFVRIRSIEHPDEYVDVYKGSLTALVNALLKSEAELNRVDLRSSLFASQSAQ